eukprot:277884_1
MGARICYCPSQEKQQSLLEDEHKSYSEQSLQQERKPKEKTYNQWIELLFWTFAGSSTHSKKKLYMNMEELNRFIDIVNLDSNEDESVVVTAHTVLEVLGKADHQKKLMTCNEFCEFFCDQNVNPHCEQIKEFVEKQTNWILLQNALKIFDVVDVDKSGSIEYNEFTVFCKLIGETDPVNIERLWNVIDTDQNGQIVIHELFDWYQQRLVSQQQDMLDNPVTETPR